MLCCGFRVGNRIREEIWRDIVNTSRAERYLRAMKNLFELQLQLKADLTTLCDGAIGTESDAKLVLGVRRLLAITDESMEEATNAQKALPVEQKLRHT